MGCGSSLPAGPTAASSVSGPATARSGASAPAEKDGGPTGQNAGSGIRKAGPGPVLGGTAIHVALPTAEVVGAVSPAPAIPDRAGDGANPHEDPDAAKIADPPQSEGPRDADGGVEDVISGSVVSPGDQKVPVALTAPSEPDSAHPPQALASVASTADDASSASAPECPALPSPGTALVGVPLGEVVKLMGEVEDWYACASCQAVLEHLGPRVQQTGASAARGPASHALVFGPYAMFVHAVRGLMELMVSEGMEGVQVWMEMLRMSSEPEEAGYPEQVWKTAQEVYAEAGGFLSYQDVLVLRPSGPGEMELRAVVTAREEGPEGQAAAGRLGVVRRVTVPLPQCAADDEVARRLGISRDPEQVARWMEAYIESHGQEGREVLAALWEELPRATGTEIEVPDRRLQFVLGSGVSLAFLSTMVEVVREWYPGAKTRDVAMKFIKPLTFATRRRFYEQLPPGGAGRPELFVSHMQDARFTEVMGDVLLRLSDADQERTYVWFDIFSINQHDLGTSAPGDSDLDYLQASLLATRRGTLMVMRPSLTAPGARGDELKALKLPTSRVWCVYEGFSTVDLRGPGFLHVQQVGLTAHEWDAVVGGLDIAKCESFSQTDKAAIMAEVEKGPSGVAGLNQNLRALFSLQPLFFDEEVRQLGSGGEVDVGPVLNWVRKEGGGRVALVSGPGGGGKSTVSAALVRAAGRGGGAGGLTVLHHFIKHNDTARQSALGAVRTLAYQLFRAFPQALGEYFSAYGPGRVAALENVDEAIGQLLVEPLRVVLEGAGGGAPAPPPVVVVVLDALDEGIGMSEAARLAGLTTSLCMANRMLDLARRLRKALPEGARLVVTSRPPEGPEEYIGSVLDDLHPHRVEVQECLGTRAAVDRLQGKVAEWLEQSADDVGAALEAGAGGSLVYLRLVVEAGEMTLRGGRGLPADLDDAYEQYLGAHGGGPEEVRELLEVLAAAREPLALSQLVQMGFPDVAGSLARCMGMLFHVGADFKVYGMHKTVFDFLGRARGPWRADVGAGHRALAEALGREVEGMGARAASGYCLRNAVHHALEAGGGLVDRVAGDVRFWEACYGEGQLQAMMDLLHVPEGRRSSVHDDAARTMVRHHTEFMRFPGMVRQRAYDAPLSTHFPRTMREMGIVPPGRLLHKPQTWPAERQRLEGHSFGVTSVCFSPDGALLASGGYDKTVRVWDARTGEERQRLEGHSGWVHSVCFSPDSAVLASGCADTTVRVWDARTGEERQRLEGHSNKVTSVCFSPDGAVLASGSYDKTVRVWDARTGKKLRRLEGHTIGVYSVCFSPDGAVLASGSMDRTVRVWDARTGEERQCLKGHSDGVTSVCFSPDGAMLASGSYDKTVRVWDARTGEERQRLEGHSNKVTSVCFGPYGAVLASGSYDKTVRVWDARTGEERQRLEGHTIGVHSVCFSPDGAVLASGSEDKTVRVWNTRALELRQRLEGHSNGVTSVCFSPDGALLASAGYDKTVRVYDARTGEERQRLEGYSGWVYSVCFSPDSAVLASGCADKTVRVLDARTGDERQRLEGHSNGVTSVCFSPDGEMLASGSHDKTVRVWDARTGEERQRLEGHSNEVTSVCFSPDGAVLASGSRDSTVRVWDARTGEERQRLEGHSSEVWSVCFSHDGAVLASGSYDKTVRVWDARTGEERQRLEGHSNKVTSVCFIPYGAVLASCSYDKTVRVWDARTGEERQRLEGHTNGVYSVCFSPDGAVLASGSEDKTVRVWNTRAWEGRQRVEGHSNGVTSVCFSPDGAVLASGSYDKTVRVWDARTGEERQRLEGHSDEVYSVCFSPDGAVLASGSRDHTLRVWDARTGEERQRLGHSNGVTSVCFSPDGAVLASGSHDWTVRVWDARTGKILQRLEGQAHVVWSVCFSPDGAVLASGSSDRNTTKPCKGRVRYATVRVWDARTGEERQRLEGRAGEVQSVCFSPDGAVLASGSTDSTLRVWDARTGEERQRLEGHSDEVTSVCFSPDGEMLASGSRDSTVRVWDARTGEERQRLEGHSGEVYSVCFSPDGAMLASGSYDKTVRVWDMRTGEERQQRPLMHANGRWARWCYVCGTEWDRSKGSCPLGCNLWDEQERQRADLGERAAGPAPVAPAQGRHDRAPAAPGGRRRARGGYKTQLCRFWGAGGGCRRGAKCRFAHGEADLR